MTLPKKTVDVLDNIVKAIPNKDQAIIKSIFSQDALDAIKRQNMAKIETKKSFKDLFYNFFGMNENWSLKRNLLGGFMVHCPEYPTYFIPAFTQAKSTGDAKDLKRGEGPRGLITGGLEGVAVGALVSGEFLKPREMGPYIILGAALQMFSCTVFPWLGEKMGRQFYNKKMDKLTAQVLETQPNVVQNKTDVGTNDSNNIPKKTQTFKGLKSYNLYNSGNMKI